MKEHAILELSVKDSIAIADAILTPPPPNTTAIGAARRHHKRTNKQRAGWAQAAKKIAKAKQDKLVWPEFANAEDKNLEW